MAAVQRSELVGCLTTKIHAEQDDSRRHIWFTVRIGGVVHATTMVSHGSERQIGQPLLGRIARQLGITTNQLIDLVSCSLSEHAYYQLLAESSEESRPSG